MPAALTFPLQSKTYNWWYESEPEPFMFNRRIYQPRGKVLGGSSSINGMIFIRGNALDFEKWAENKGLEDWGYANCLPYFKKMENHLLGGDSYRQTGGPLNLMTHACKNELFEVFFKAVQQAGYPLTEDVNGYQQEGFAPFDATIYRGRRFSAARAYYHPIKKRKNLDIIFKTQVTEILFEKKRATGVRCVRGKKEQQISAGEVLLCGGAINSPQLLQLSGIGNGKELNDIGIKVRQDLPGVGENLQDHLELYVQYACKKPVSMYPALKTWRRPQIGFQWLFLHKGAGATNHFEAGGFVRGNNRVKYPNLQFHFLPVAIRYDGSSPHGGHGFQLHVGPMNTDVKGFVKIKSKDGLQYPRVFFNYLSTRQEQKEWVEAISVARKLINQPAFDDYRGEEISPGASVQAEKEILDVVGREGESAYHPSCTCKMGYDNMAVTDKSLKVHGLENLRVVDASIMPSITNGNIYAPVLMIAEKAADMILGNSPLGPEKVEFYQAKKSK